MVLVTAPPKSGLGDFSPQVGNLQIVDSSVSSLTLQAEVNITNPTNYSCTIPYVDMLILTNGTVLGHAIVKDMTVVPGHNENLVMQVAWDPLKASGSKGRAVGREFLSRFISGKP